MSIVQNVGLEDGHLSGAGGDELDVRLGSAGVNSGELGEAQLAVERGNKRVTNSIISTGGTAGGQSDADGRRGIAAVVAGVALAVIGLLVAAGDQSKDHREGENKS